MYKYLVLLSLSVIIAWCGSTGSSDTITESDPYTNITDTIVVEPSLTDPTLDETPLPDNLDEEIITQPDMGA